jgi:hypothetical protein
MIAWKSRIWPRLINPRMKIPSKQISIIKASLECYKSKLGIPLSLGQG